MVHIAGKIYLVKCLFERPVGLINQPRNQDKRQGQNLKKRGKITINGILDNKKTFKRPL